MDGPVRTPHSETPRAARGPTGMRKRALSLVSLAIVQLSNWARALIERLTKGLPDSRFRYACNRAACKLSLMSRRGFRQEQRRDLNISGDRIAQHSQSLTLFSSDIGEFLASMMWMDSYHMDTSRSCGTC